MRKRATCFTRKVVTTGRRAVCRAAWRAGCGAVARLTEYLGDEAEPDETAGTETGAGDGFAVEALGVVVAFGGAGVFGSAGTGAGAVVTGGAGTGAGGFGTVG